MSEEHLLKGGQEGYNMLSGRAAAGDYGWMVEPLDWKILELLPDEGTNVAGLYQLGSTVKEINKKFGGAVNSGLLSGRIKSMQAGGLTRSVRMVGSAGVLAWQKTTKGKEMLTAWQQKQ